MLGNEKGMDWARNFFVLRIRQSAEATGWKWNFGEIKKLSSSSVARTLKARAFDTEGTQAEGTEHWARALGNGGGHGGPRHRGVERVAEVETVAARTAIYVERELSPDSETVVDESVQSGQICQSEGLVSIDRSEAAALLSTTPRLRTRSSTNDFPPLRCMGWVLVSA